MKKRVYVEAEIPDPDRVEKAIREDDDATSLVELVVDVTMCSPDARWAESVCLRLASHQVVDVRVIAIYGLSHIARRFGELGTPGSVDAVEAAMADESPAVREIAFETADDIERFTEMRVERVLPDPRGPVPPPASG